MRGKYIALGALICGAALMASGCTKLKARDNLNKGVQAFKAGQYAESALEQFNKALASNPTEQDKVIATQSIASIYFNEKDFDKAVEWNKKLIAIKPDSKEAY